ncbi:hypothetical protein, partial [Desulfosporosinus sp. I2]|uniref:hypothetical protein n=1 Tax=Desulfosporosinus sp. I2 TaxID=1617025 RepID=UPI001A9A3E19
MPLKAQNHGPKTRHKFIYNRHECTLGALCRQIMDNLHRHSFDLNSVSVTLTLIFLDLPKIKHIYRLKFI